MADEAEKKDDVNWEELKPQILKLALELGPLIIFYLGFVFGNRIIASVPQFSAAGFSDPLYPATLLFMVAMVLSIVLSWALLHKVAVMPMVTAIVVLVFGALTFIFHDTNFAKMKPTVVNALFALTLLGGLAFGQSLLRYVFGDVYKLKPKGWTILTLRWGLFFLFLAVLNEAVWRVADAVIVDPKAATDIWVNFKFYGTTPITIVFTLFQLPILNKYAPDAETPAAPGGEPTV